MSERFQFAFEPRLRRLSSLFGVTPLRAWVEVGEERLVAQFGPWRVETPLTNVAEVSITGPYQLLKVAGPAHLSLADRGLTFATNTQRGVCVLFRRPVKGIDPFGFIRHPGLTVTVAEPERLVEVLEQKALHRPPPTEQPGQ